MLPPIKHVDGTIADLPAHTTILGLPCKEIKQGGEWLSHKTKADPEDHVACDLALNAPDLLDGVSERDEWNLDHHARKCHTNDVMCGHSDKQLMKYTGKEEDKNLSHGRGDATTD